MQNDVVLAFFLKKFQIKKKKTWFRTPSLLHKTTISWPEPESESLSTVTEAEPDSISTSTATLQLHHIDSLSFHKTPDQLFNLKLQRDALRANSLLSLAAAKRGRGGGLESGDGVLNQVFFFLIWNFFKKKSQNDVVLHFCQKKKKKKKKKVSFLVKAYI